MMPRLTDKPFCAHCSMDVPQDYVTGSPFVCANCTVQNNTLLYGMPREHYRALMDWCQAGKGRTWCVFLYDDEFLLFCLSESNWVFHSTLIDINNFGDAIPNAIAMWHTRLEQTLRREGILRGAQEDDRDVLYEFEIGI